MKDFIYLIFVLTLIMTINKLCDSEENREEVLICLIFLGVLVFLFCI